MSTCRTDTEAAGAERNAYRHLLLPRGAAREQQAADVDARQQQHTADDRHQQQQRPAELLMQRRRESGARRRDIDYDLKPLRISLCKGLDSGPIQHLHFSPRLFDRHARLEPRSECQPRPGPHHVRHRGE